MRRFLVVTGSLVVLMFAATTGWAEVRNPYAVAVIIGNKTYENREVPEVKYAERDAQAIKNYVIDVLGYSEDNIIYLSNATQSKMLSVFGSANDPRGRLAQWLRPGGKSDVLVYYSGHGVPGLSDGQSYLLPVDANPNTVSQNGYPVNLLYGNLQKIGARSVTVLLDACFSGTSAGGALLTNASVMSRPASAAPRPAEAGGMTVLTASRADQLANWDDKHKHGLFTEYFLEAVYGRADDPQYGGHGDGKITLGAVQAYLDQEMSFIAGREDARPQDATISGEASKVLAAFSPGHAPPRRDEALPPPTPVAVAKPAPTTSPALDEAALNLSDADRIAIEQWLTALDYDAGENGGGPFDAATRDAITDFERAIGAPATSYLNRDVLARLRHDGQAKLRADTAAANVPVIPAVTPMNYADELTDFGVYPQPFLQFAVATQTPLSIPGGQMITTANLVGLINDLAREHRPLLLVDALSGAGHATLRNAVRLPFAGSGGNFNDQAQQALASQLSALTGNQADTPMVFFCQGAVCWESYNAALRAIYMGFRRVYWYRGGLTAWREANLPMD